MENDRKKVISETLEAVRERALYSNELGFINHTKNTIKTKGGLYTMQGI